jgi:YgiT-type zinc finger domain-containing protein
MNDLTPDNFPCAECQAGHLHRRFVTYFTWIADELVTVPDFPSWVCDVCGRREYDPQALNQLALLLSPDAGKPATRKRLKPPRSKTKGNRPVKSE